MRAHDSLARTANHVGALSGLTRAIVAVEGVDVVKLMQNACNTAGVVLIGARSTDPDEMARLLAQPPGTGRGEHWFLGCRKPDAQLMKELDHRLMGPPAQTVDVGGTQPVTIHITHEQVPE